LVACALILVAARWIDPPTTAVHMQRRLQAWIHHTPYRERYKFIPLSNPPDLQHAVIAAEDAHFYTPWIRLARDPNRCRRRFGRRSHSRSFHHYAATRKKPILRNGPLYPPQAQRSLCTGCRIRPRQKAHLEIYLNVVEWGPGIYGAESACRYHDETAAAISAGNRRHARCNSASSLKRRPERMNNYSAIILTRMDQMGWYRG